MRSECPLSWPVSSAEPRSLSRAGPCSTSVFSARLVSPADRVPPRCAGPELVHAALVPSHPAYLSRPTAGHNRSPGPHPAHAAQLPSNPAPSIRGLLPRATPAPSPPGLADRPAPDPSRPKKGKLTPLNARRREWPLSRPCFRPTTVARGLSGNPATIGEGRPRGSVTHGEILILFFF